MLRKVIHIDMDAFYASVEQRDFQEYRHKPLCVGGSPQGRGVVAACSYEARRFGIHSAMPASQALRRCPDAIFVQPRFPVYRQISRQIQSLLRAYTSLVEPVSLDEAYLDVSQVHVLDGSATKIARAIKRRINDSTGLTASAGVSYNKFLAKIASDMEKPDGLFVITPQRGPLFTERLPIGRFHGIGKATEARMKALGIHNGADLKSVPRHRLQRLFGKMGDYYYDVARGIDKRPVLSQRVRKSFSSEQTFEQDIGDMATLLYYLERLAEKVVRDLQQHRLAGKTLSIKVKYDDFELITRSMTFNTPLQDFKQVSPLLSELLDKTDVRNRKVRLLGVGFSNLSGLESRKRERQLRLF